MRGRADAPLGMFIVRWRWAFSLLEDTATGKRAKPQWDCYAISCQARSPYAAFRIYGPQFDGVITSPKPQIPYIARKVHQA